LDYTQFFSHYTAGVNLGGWLSQYQNYDHSHFTSFITEQDIQRIASWGMDHVRLPVDYPILEADSQPFHYLESGLVYLDQCLAWCKKAGLGLIIDLHKAPGYGFDHPSASSLFDDPLKQERFLALWVELTRRYKSEGSHLTFELLNEIVLPTSLPWNLLANRAIQAIRGIDQQRIIILGGNHYNSIAGLSELDLFRDQRIVYTFHYYEPMVVTHQKAPWVPSLQAFDQQVDYPGICLNLDIYLQSHPEFQNALQAYSQIKLNKEYLRTLLLPAVEFRHRSGQPIYCGEYGVIDRAPASARLNWHRDFVDLLREYHIGRACWSYKAMDFGLVDLHGNIVDQKIVQTVSTR
jgi:hypothetical protein